VFTADLSSELTDERARAVFAGLGLDDEFRGFPADQPRAVSSTAISSSRPPTGTSTMPRPGSRPDGKVDRDRISRLMAERDDREIYLSE